MRDLKEYRMATSPAEAVAMLHAGPGKGCYIAGGTDIYFGFQNYDYVVDITQAGLDGITGSEGGDVRIGATTPLQECFNSVLLQNFAGGEISRVAGQCGDRCARSAATIGGNLCNALPSADLAPVLMALDAKCLILDENSQESVPLSDFFVAPRQTVLKKRLLEGVVLPGETFGWRCQNFKLTRSAKGIALVQVAVALKVKKAIIKKARIALGGVAPVPLRCLLAENLLVNLKLGEITPRLVEDAAILAAKECDPIDDHRASAEYRLDMVRVLTRRLICRVLAEEGMDSSCDSDHEGGDEGTVA